MYLVDNFRMASKIPTRRKNQNVESVDRYHQIEGWCRSAVANNNEMIYDSVIFHESLRDAEKRFGIPVEVSFSKTNERMTQTLTPMQVSSFLL